MVRRTRASHHLAVRKGEFVVKLLVGGGMVGTECGEVGSGEGPVFGLRAVPVVGGHVKRMASTNYLRDGSFAPIS